MTAEKRDFDKEAARWDSTGRIRLAEDIMVALTGQLPLDRSMHVLDFGCGTGLLALRLAPLVGFRNGPRQLARDAGGPQR